MGKFTFVCKEHFGELVTYGCDQMSGELWSKTTNTPLDPISYAQLLELQAAHIRDYCYKKDAAVFLNEAHKRNGFTSRLMTVKEFKEFFGTDLYVSKAAVDKFYENHTANENAE